MGLVEVGNITELSRLAGLQRSFDGPYDLSLNLIGAPVSFPDCIFNQPDSLAQSLPAHVEFNNRMMPGLMEVGEIVEGCMVINLFIQVGPRTRVYFQRIRGNNGDCPQDGWVYLSPQRFPDGYELCVSDSASQIEEGPRFRPIVVSMQDCGDGVYAMIESLRKELC